MDSKIPNHNPNLKFNNPAKPIAHTDPNFTLTNCNSILLSIVNKVFTLVDLNVVKDNFIYFYQVAF